MTRLCPDLDVRPWERAKYAPYGLAHRILPGRLRVVLCPPVRYGCEAGGVAAGHAETFADWTARLLSSLQEARTHGV